MWQRSRLITISSATILYCYLFFLALTRNHNSVHEIITSEVTDLKRVDEQNNLQASNASSMKEKELEGSDDIDEQKEWEDTKVTPINNNTSPTLCRQVYFWGGGKAGSTSLFFTLTYGPGGVGNPQNTGPFVRAFPKEPCGGSEWKMWEALTKDTNKCRGGSDSNSFTHILNGCPRVTSIPYARKAMTLSDNPKFLMLIRDPVDRYVSFLNDSVRRGGSKMNIEDAAKNKRSGFGMNLVRQGAQLKTLLSVVKDPKQILIIPMESISLNAEGVIDAVMDHVEGRRWKRNETEARNPGSVKMNVGTTDKYKYVTVSDNTTEILRNEFRQDVLLLESLVGKRFSWSSWARKDDDNSAGENEEQESEFWLVTSPASG
eukprot:CAMPEP_0201697530 /NCGR_PEP_ID=MMETSP0578-20130828/11367_1 /ASSEMBLY_ACC=CAM_ASM_000663 /TAXON_ID=267565 /ORGANISM="Skeletonema grethea, Strain CCMP 1804" /LENGTH=373 /DNA_ID=CAMNT_0048183719 /DNA_START=194 /DNA_END=1316 /DNA_ORIENTATION=-